MQQFCHSERLLGCVAHVINLAAQAALSVLGRGEEDLVESKLPSDLMDIGFLVSRPDGSHIDLARVYKRLHALAVFLRTSPQRKELFKERVRAKQPELFAKSISTLILDVRTRWNSSFAMLQRMLDCR